MGMETDNMILRENDILCDNLTGEPDENSSDRLPTDIIITNLVTEVFDEDSEKNDFESLFHDIDEYAVFYYFKSFTRVRVNFSSPEKAAEAKNRMNLSNYKGQIVKCFFIQPITIGSNSPHLAPPKREKQFLISPPASPPVGWEPCDEAQPRLNYDLLAAVANLAPGEAHELHPATTDQPGIVVHICERDPCCEANPSGVRIPQTQCPERSPSSEHPE